MADDKKEIKATIHMEASIMEVADAEQHVVEGYASTFKPTRNGWIIPKSEMVRALAGYLENPVLLYMHDQDRVIGKVLEAKIDDKGVWIKAKIDDEEIWEKIKKGHLRGFSVGGIGKVVEIDNNLSHVMDFDLWEISVVSVPADRGALIEIINYTPAVKNTPYDLSTDWDWDWAKDADIIIEKYGWKGLASACAYVEKDGDKLPEKKEAYKLPHHKLINGKLTLVRGGVNAALRRLPQTDLPEKDRELVRKHLEAHKAFLDEIVKKEKKNANIAETIKESEQDTQPQSTKAEEKQEGIEATVIQEKKNDAEEKVENTIKIDNKYGGDLNMNEKVNTSVTNGPAQINLEDIENKVLAKVDEKMNEFQRDLKKIESFVSALDRETAVNGNTLTKEVQADILRNVMAKVAGRTVQPAFPATKRILADYMESVDEQGGYLVLPEYEKVIDAHIVASHPLLQKFPYETVGSPKIVKFKMLNPANATDPVEQAVITPYMQRWTIESTTIPTVQTPVFAQETKDIRAMAGIFRVSEMLLEDVGNFYDLIGSIMNIISVGINNTLDKEIADYLNALTATELGAHLKSGTDLPTLDDLRAWTKEMLYKGFGNLFWLMSDDVEQYYMTQKDSNGLYLFGDAINGVTDTIWNIPVIVDKHLPENSIYLISADSTFSIKRLTGFRIDQNRNSYNEFVSGFILYRFILRVDWDIAWNAGIMKFVKTT